MDNKTQITKYKYRILCLLCLALFFLYGFASSYTVKPVRNEEIPMELTNLYAELSKQPNVIWSFVAVVNNDSLLKADSVQVYLDNEMITVHLQYMEKDSNNHYRYLTSDTNDASMSLSYVDKFLLGRVNSPSGHYEMISLSNNALAVTKFIEDDMEEEPIPLPTPNNKVSNDSIIMNEVTANRDAAPIIRVLFLYTSSALSMMNPLGTAKMKAIAYEYINNANLSFHNSNINARLQLAYIGSTDFSEAGSMTWSDILSYFKGSNDGYIDEVHSLRNKYAADVCVLFIKRINEYCGLGYINADSSTAFCLTYPHNGCNNKYTAVHEIGHIIGCNHNRGNAHNSAFSYGHGFIHYVSSDPLYSWRTMMSYDSLCATGCTRIPYWSNPDVYYNGIAMGTTTYENNARVWNERAPAVSFFTQKPFFVTYNANNNNYQSIYESVDAYSIITTYNGYEIQSGQTVDFSSGVLIRLKADTHIKAGSTFRASIRIGADNNSYPQFEKAKVSDVDEIIVTKSLANIEEIPASKILRNGQIFIVKDGKTYTLTGQEIRDNK